MVKNTNKSAINTPTASARKKSTVDGALPPKVLEVNPDELVAVSEALRDDDAEGAEWVDEDMVQVSNQFFEFRWKWQFNGFE